MHSVLRATTAAAFERSGQLTGIESTIVVAVDAIEGLLETTFESLAPATALILIVLPHAARPVAVEQGTGAAGEFPLGEDAVLVGVERRQQRRALRIGPGRRRPNRRDGLVGPDLDGRRGARDVG